MKKRLILLILLSIVLLTGCTNVSDMKIEDIVNKGVDRNITIYNKYRKGYKYNLPRGLGVTDSTEYNEVIESEDYRYYLYIDAVSYFNKVIETYKVNDKAYVSMPISYEDKYGYLEINEQKNGKYFIEIMYNYAKIEVIVKSYDINAAVANALSILASVEFNDNVLKTLLDEEISQFKEFEFNIFTTKTDADSEYLKAVEDDIYEDDDDDEIHDSDLIN